jgi:nucleoside-diphosphate-sugar epimerase
MSTSFLITGATGFIGANLARRLIKEDAEVHILTRKQSNRWRLQDILQKVQEHQVDLRDYERLFKVVQATRPKFIFHCTTYGGYPFQREENKIIETNILGTINLLKALSDIDYRYFVNTGSSSEYGIKSKPMSEEDLLEPISAYGVSKAAITLFCQAMATREKRPIVTLRLFSPYGPYEEATRLIPTVIISCLRDKSLRLSSPQGLRDFNFVEDVVDAYLKVIETPNIAGEIFNIGCGEQHSVGEVVNKIVELIGNKVRPEWGSVPKRAIEPNVWQADITKAKNVLKWKPKYSLEKGLAKTIKWFMENMNLYEKQRRENKNR